MAASAWSGPLVQYGGVSPYGSGIENNPDRGPAALDMGMMLLDPRQPYTYIPGNPASSIFRGFVGGEYIVLDAAPSAISAVNIAASQSPVAGAITLVSVTGAGITAGVSITRADTGATVTGLLAIDGAAGDVNFGSTDGQAAAWDPTTLLARNVRITSGGNDSGIVYTVNGYDIYGYPMSEAITGANAGVASGKKAFKYISSVTHTGSVGTTVTIGTGDVFGFPLRDDNFFYADIAWNGTRITANTGWLAADTTSPATTTTGDVRGTYAVQSASDGTKKLQVRITPSVANLANTTSLSTGLFGVTQV